MVPNRKALPLLQFTLAKLYENCRNSERPSEAVVLTNQVYDDVVGGLTGSINQHAEKTFKDLCNKHSQPNVETAFKTIFSRLIQNESSSNEENRGWTAVSKTQSELTSSNLDEEVLEDVLHQFDKSRLLEIRRAADNPLEPVYHLRHDSIITSWDRLTKLADEILLHQNTLRQLELFLANRTLAAKENEYLTRGTLLTNANHVADLAKGAPYLLSKESAGLIKRSNRRNKLKTTARNLLVAGVLCTLSILTIFSLIQWNKAELSATNLREANGKTEKALSTSRLNEGKAWLERAEVAAQKSEPFAAAMMAGRAIGYQGYGGVPNKSDYPFLITPRHLKEFRKANYIISSQLEEEIIQTWVSPIFSNHQAHIYSVAVSHDGSKLASGSDDNTIRVWDARSGRLIGKPCLGHLEGVASIDFSPDSSQIVSGSYDNTIRLWDANSGQPYGEPLVGHKRGVMSVAFSRDGSLIVSGSLDNTIRLWDARSGLPFGEALIGHSKEVTSVAFSPDGSQIISGSKDNTIRLWDTHSGQLIGEPLISSSDAVYDYALSVKAVAFSPDGSQIVAGFEDATIQRWNTRSRQPLGEPLIGHTMAVFSIAFSRDGSQIVSGSEDDTIRIWDAQSGQPIGEPLSGHSNGVTSAHFFPDGTKIVSGSLDNTIRVWDVLSGKHIGKPFLGHSERVTNVAFSPDGSKIVSGSLDNTIRLWDARSGQLIGKPFHGHSFGIASVAFSPDSSLLVSGSYDNTIRLWDAATGQTVGSPFVGHSRSVMSVCFSPDGSQIVSGSADNKIRLWDTYSGQPIGGPFLGHSGDVTSVAFSPDGSLIVSGSEDKSLRLWNTHSQIGKFLAGHSDWVNCVAFSPDGSQIVSGSRDNTIRVWDANSRKLVDKPLVGHSGSVRSVAFSPDGSQIVSGSTDNTIRLWDARSLQPIGKPLAGHFNPNSDSFLSSRFSSFGNQTGVESVAFSPDGTQIVSGGYDKTIRLWGSRSGPAVGKPLLGHLKAISSLAFSPDGSQIASGSLDETIRLWDTRSGRPIGLPFHFSDLKPPPDLATKVLFNNARIAPNFNAQLYKSLKGEQQAIERNSLALAQPLFKLERGLSLDFFGGTNTPLSITFNPDSFQIISGSQDKKIRLWDVRSGQLIKESLFDGAEKFTSLAISPDDSQIASVSKGNTIQLWDFHSGQSIGKPLLGHLGTVTTVAYSPDGSQIVSSSLDKTIRFWNPDTGRPNGKPLLGHKKGVTTVAFSPDGDKIISGSEDSTIRLWDSHSGVSLGKPIFGHLKGVTSVAFSPDGEKIVSGSADNTIRIWDAFCPPAQNLYRNSHSHNKSNFIVKPQTETSSLSAIAHQPSINLRTYLTTGMFQLSETSLLNVIPTNNLFDSGTSLPVTFLPANSLNFFLNSDKNARINILLDEENWPQIFQEYPDSRELISTQLKLSLAQTLLLTAGNEWSRNASRVHVLFPSIPKIITEELINSGKLDLALLDLIRHATEVSDKSLRNQYWPLVVELLTSSQDEMLLLYAIDILSQTSDKLVDSQSWKKSGQADLIESFYRKNGVNIESENYLNLAITFELTKNEDLAIRSYYEVLIHNRDWAEPDRIFALDRPSSEQKSLLRILKLTLEKHPELILHRSK